MHEMKHKHFRQFHSIALFASHFHATRVIRERSRIAIETIWNESRYISLASSFRWPVFALFQFNLSLIQSFYDA